MIIMQVGFPTLPTASTTARRFWGGGLRRVEFGEYTISLSGDAVGCVPYGPPQILREIPRASLCGSNFFFHFSIP